MRAVMCVGLWSRHGFIKADDSRPLESLEDVEPNDDDDENDYLMDDGWDRIRGEEDT